MGLKNKHTCWNHIWDHKDSHWQWKSKCKAIEEYITMMDPNCTITRDHGFRGMMIYRSIYISYSWIHHNMISVSHTFSFYIISLYTIECMMIEDMNFFMWTQLLSTMFATKLLSTSLSLSCLFTRICSTPQSKIKSVAYTGDRSVY